MNWSASAGSISFPHAMPTWRAINIIYNTIIRNQIRKGRTENMKQEQWLGAPSATRAVVVGGGIMGADVAVVLLRASCKTVVVEPRQALHEGIREKIAENLAVIDRGQNISLLTMVASIDDIDWQDVNLMIECVPESLDIKRDLFKALAGKAPAHTLLASNSSSFPISQIAQGLPTQARMIGLHFFMPAH